MRICDERLEKEVNMQLDSDAFARLRRLAPVLDDVLNAREVEHADQAVNLQSLAELCVQLFESYDQLHPGRA